MCVSCWRIAWTITISSLIGSASAHPPTTASTGPTTATPKSTAAAEDALGKALQQQREPHYGTVWELAKPPWQIDCPDLACDKLRIVRFDDRVRAYIESPGSKVVVRDKAGTEVPVVLEYAGGKIVSAVFLGQAGERYEVALTQTPIDADNRDLIARRKAGESPQEVAVKF